MDQASTYSDLVTGLPYNGTNGHLTVAELLQLDLTTALVRPAAPVPHEQGNAGWHALELLLRTDMTRADPWPAFRIMREVIAGFDALAHFPPSVSLFGSTRTRPGSPDYLAALETARLLAQAGFGVITGGDPGIMEATNKGAQEGGCTSLA